MSSLFLPWLATLSCERRMVFHDRDAGWQPLMAGRMVALWQALFRWWWLPSWVVGATGGVAVSSSDVPSLSEGRRPNPDLEV